MAFLCVAIFVMAFGLVTKLIVSGAWIKDLTPPSQAGQFQGIRMIFWIAIPMVVGPAIGSALIRAYGIPTVVEGEAGFIPVPVIFQVGSAIALLALIPLFFIRRRQHAARAD
jgi:MFS family permease